MPFSQAQLTHTINESNRMKIALFHYAYLNKSLKSKRTLAELYDINLNTFKSKWSKSSYPKHY